MQSATENQPAAALFIAYYYPPILSTGIARSVQFIRYLPEFGYSARVLTTCAFGSDPEQALRAWEPLSAYRRLFHRKGGAEPTPSHVRTRSRLTRTLRWLSRYLLIPDAQVTWLPNAFLKGIRAIKRDHIGLIYSSFPPGSAHLLALALKRVTGLPWVADFRDSWVYDPLDPANHRIRYRGWVERRMERAVVQAADQVVCSTVISADYLKASYPSSASRIRVITNGHASRFEPREEMPQEAADAGGNGETLRIVHTGSFSLSHPQRSPGPLFLAIERLVDRDASWSDRLRLVLIGPLSDQELKASAKLRQSGVVEVHGAVSGQEALAWQRRADLLLLVDHKRDWPASNVPGKFYEYLATRKPILALCGPGMVDRMMTELEAGFRASVDDPESIAQALASAFSLHSTGRMPGGVDEEILHRFHRRQLTAELADCFDRARSRRTCSR